MKNVRLGKWLVYLFCGFLTIAAFFAKDFVLYDFHMLPSDYSFAESRSEKPIQALTGGWFSYGSDRQLLYGLESNITLEDVRLYGKTEEQTVEITASDLQPIRNDLIGYIIAVLPEQIIDTDNDGITEHVYDSVRADFSRHAYELAPREFDSGEIPFELAFAERKYIQVFYKNVPLVNADLTVASSDGKQQTYQTDGHGWIEGLPSSVLRNGFTVTYSPDNETTYRTYYAIEDYDYFTEHFFKAYLPLLLVLLLSVIGIIAFYFIREAYAKRNPAYEIYARERPGLRGSKLNTKSDSRFLMIRWLFLIFGFFLWSFAGKLISQEQTLNHIAVPVFSCPFNLDQTLESSCYYLTHLPTLFTRNWGYIVSFLVTLMVFVVLGGRILCGFMCPLGFVQDLFDKLRRTLHIRPVTVSDKMNQVLQPLKWVWTILFLCFVFTGGDFCDICPNKVFSPALGGWWVNLALGGFLTIPLIVGSFYIKRFWCLMCPMGFLLGLFHRFNLFKLKKNCTACTECGACYESCPMRLKNIYTEREKEEVQTIDCLMCGECIVKCPEDHALSMTFCGKTILKSSRVTFMSKYASKSDGGSRKEESSICHRKKRH